MRTVLLAAVMSTLLGSLHAQCDGENLFVTGFGPIDEYGSALEVDGEWAFVTSRFGDTPSGGDGIVDIFRHDGTAWVLHQQLSAPDGATDRVFGEALDIDGTRAVITARANTLQGGTSAAYVLDFDGSVWALSQILPSPSGEFSFGAAVSLDGDRFVVGAPYDDGFSLDVGRAYVYRRTGSGWVLESTLDGTALQGFDKFGDSVALEDPYVVVGAPNWDQPGGDDWDDDGTAFVFRRTGLTWSSLQQLEPLPSSTYSEHFGIDVDLDGGILVALSPEDFGPGWQNGAVWGWRLVSGSFVSEGVISPAGNTPFFLQLGDALDLDDGRLVVGVPENADAGMGLVFERVGAGDWNQVDVLEVCDNNGAFRTGTAVGVSGDRVLLGAPSWDYTGSYDLNVGAVYPYELDGPAFAGQRKLTSTPFVSAADGGTATFLLIPENQASTYLLLGSVTGTTPGIPLAGGTLPLNFDAYTEITLAPFAGVFDAFGGFFNGDSAVAHLNVPSGNPPVLAGVTFSHAFVGFDGNGSIVQISEAGSFTIQP